jgi:PAP2 superfamily
MWLAWQPAVLIAIVLAAFGVAARRAGNHRVVLAGAFARETALVLALYAIWKIAGQLSVMQMTGALDRGRWVWQLERTLHLPSEVTVQRAVLPYGWLVQGADSYYAIVHVPALIAFLVWLFVRHRDRYPQVRNVLAIATGAGLAVQLVPLAPPRMFPGLGFVDTAARYHQSVYEPLGRGLAGQLAAMPSIHVAWAVLIGVAIFQIARGAGRWIGPGHAVVTVLVVVITANHWWLDGIVAVMLLGLAWVVERSTRSAVQTWRQHLALQRADLIDLSDLGEGSVAISSEPGGGGVAERGAVPGVRIP